jgi:hypothetical protein
MDAPNHGWNHLDNAGQKKFAQNCVRRRAAYETWVHHRELAEAKDILIIADRPGPKAPQQDDYHHTPFYAKIHSGGWLNAYLVDEGIEETRLMWVNSATWDNCPESTDILSVKDWPYVFCLGLNAQKWFAKNRSDFDSKVWELVHPQFHKRFVGSHGYPLVDRLKDILNTG